MYLYDNQKPINQYIENNAGSNAFSHTHIFPDQVEQSRSMMLPRAFCVCSGIRFVTVRWYQCIVDWRYCAHAGWERCFHALRHRPGEPARGHQRSCDNLFHRPELCLANGKTPGLQELWNGQHSTERMLVHHHRAVVLPPPAWLQPITRRMLPSFKTNQHARSSNIFVIMLHNYAKICA